MKHKKKTELRTVSLAKSSYQPSREELQEDVRLDCSLEELVEAVLQPVEIQWADKPKDKR